jgi:hypothetical protein
MELESYLSQGQKKRKKKRAYWYLAIGAVAVYLILAGTSWLLLDSPVFRMTSIVVEGNQAVPSGDIVTLLRSSVLRDHSFFRALLGLKNILIWPKELNAADLALIPRLSAVIIDKSYGAHTITANVVERTPLAIWCAVAERGQTCYWFDDRGVIFAKAFDTQGSLMFAIHDYSGTPLGLNKKVLPERFAANLVSVVKAVQESGVDVKEIALKNIELQEIDIATYDGPSLYFSLRFPAANDLPVLQNLMAKSGFGKLQYVDFRVENRAYYK